MSNHSPSRFYPPSKPRVAVGGIQARSTRGKIATTWWSTRFIEALEAMGMSSRLSRGRNYARRGQVTSLDLVAGQVTASVQGSRATPYRVRIGISIFGEDRWELIEERLAGDSWFVAQLLSGDMPTDIEALFTDLGLSLFPQRSELSLDCSCPDWEVPCKHLAAVFYLLAERFDEDPFDVLAWRGRDRESLLGRLHASSPKEATDEAVPLSELLAEFWVAPGSGSNSTSTRSDELSSDSSTDLANAGTVRREQTTAAASRVTDQFPPSSLKVRGVSLVEALAPAYDILLDEHEDR